MNQLLESRQCPEPSSTEARTLDSAFERVQPRRWLPAVEWCFLAALAVSFIFQSFLPGWGTLGSEFPNYYLAAELYHQGVPVDRVYEWTWFQRQNDHLGVRDGLVSFAPNPPTSILASLPFTRLQPLAAKRVWLVLSLVSLAISIWLLHSVTSLGWRRLVLLTLLCLLPLRIDFLFARHYALILLLICAAYYAACHSNQWTSGALWAAAAAIKLFPALAVILFIRKRNWQAVAGFFLAATVLVGVSVIVFGMEIHRVFFSEVLSQVSRGDWLGPYALSQNSFITLWSHLFLIEPELNPVPWINSPPLYALAMAITVTVLVLAYLGSAGGEKSPRSMALHWATLVPLLLLLSTTTAPDHSCILIFVATVGFDALLATGKNKQALTLLAFYVVACAPVPARVLNWFPLYRLAATTAIYALLLWSAGVGRREIHAERWLAAGLILAAALTLYNLHSVWNRDEDFSRRLPTSRNGYRFANPVPVGDAVAFTEMQPHKYGAAFLADGVVRRLALPGDTLATTGSQNDSVLYAELASRQSFVVKLPLEPLGSATQTMAEGQEPALSSNGRWLAFIREDHGISTAQLLATDSNGDPETVLPSIYKPLEVTVTDDGDVIAAAGNVSDPGLLLVRRRTGEVAALPGFPHPARYPSISPDGKRLAFSRRDRGAWHLVVHEFATGHEQQLTHASCNAVSPSWANADTLLYATDCGRGVGLSAIARIVLPN